MQYLDYIQTYWTQKPRLNYVLFLCKLLTIILWYDPYTPTWFLAFFPFQSWIIFFISFLFSFIHMQCPNPLPWDGVAVARIRMRIVRPFILVSNSWQHRLIKYLDGQSYSSYCTWQLNLLLSCFGALGIVLANTCLLVWHHLHRCTVSIYL